MKNLNRTDPEFLVPKIHGELLMGKILERAGKLSAEEIELILRHQKEQQLRFGEAAIGLGLISYEDVGYALSRQFSYPPVAVQNFSYPPELVAATNPDSAEAEALRSIRAQLNLRWFKGGQKYLAIAGINQGDGASTMIANLGISFAQLGKRTLIIDANLRRPSQDHIFGLASDAGLSDILTERMGVEGLVRTTPFKDLSVLPAGMPVLNPTELVSHPAFEQLIDTLALRFDIILCDAPAFMSVADAVSIAGAAGGVMFVVRKHKTLLNHARGANQLLIGTDIQVVGSILLDF